MRRRVSDRRQNQRHATSLVVDRIIRENRARRAAGRSGGRSSGS